MPVHRGSLRVSSAASVYLNGADACCKPNRRECVADMCDDLFLLWKDLAPAHASEAAASRTHSKTEAGAAIDLYSHGPALTERQQQTRKGG